MKTINVAKLVGWLLLCQLPGLFGMPYVYGNMNWYNALSQSTLTPPGAVFGVVWAVLYVLLGISAFYAFRNQIHGRALTLFTGQLALNACWTPVFFGAHSLTGGLLLIVALAVEFGFLFGAFWQISRKSAWLLVPYGAWLLFATYLTAVVWWLN